MNDMKEAETARARERLFLCMVAGITRLGDPGFPEPVRVDSLGVRA
jgi:hypothetical protein